jgi:hypothetical protein
LNTLDAIIILFIPKAVLATSAAVINTRIIGGAKGVYNIWCHTADILNSGYNRRQGGIIS